jgi:serine protease Do
VVGADPQTDLAVVRIDASDLSPAQMGDSDQLQVGEWVVAAGNPFGLSYTITAGIVSAKGRSNITNVAYEDFIQTDAAINPGNSGGPLVNRQGEVIGINTAIFTRSGGYMGIGFAIPSNMAQSVMRSLIEKGHVVRGWLGLGIQNLTEGLAKSFGYGSTDGILVSQVTPDSPADKAGLLEGDIITHYDGERMENMRELRSQVAETEPGTRVELKIFREGAEKMITVGIGELKAERQVSSEKIHPNLGMKVQTLTEPLARQLGYEQARGVVVSALDPLGLAARAGLRLRDVIVKVNGTNIKDGRHFWQVIEKHDLKKGVRFTLQREGQKLFVFLQEDS